MILKTAQGDKVRSILPKTFGLPRSTPYRFQDICQLEPAGFLSQMAIGHCSTVHAYT